jgi:hypothetical protein
VGLALNIFNQEHTDRSTDLPSLIEDKEGDELMRAPSDFADL